MVCDEISILATSTGLATAADGSIAHASRAISPALSVHPIVFPYRGFPHSCPRKA